MTQVTTDISILEDSNIQIANDSVFLEEFDSKELAMISIKTTNKTIRSSV